MGWRLLRVERAISDTKKFKATFYNDVTGKEKHTLFGARGMDDFTLTNDVDARDRYRQRHAKDLETGDPTRAGYLSWYLLWNKNTLAASIRDYKQKFGM